jgi:hypothetical protein
LNRLAVKRQRRRDPHGRGIQPGGSSIPTRYAVTLALATAPLVVTAEASPPEPILAAIRAHPAALALVHAMEGIDYDEAAFDALTTAETDRPAELLAMTATTLAGCAAVMPYVKACAIRVVSQFDCGGESSERPDALSKVSAGAEVSLGML